MSATPIEYSSTDAGAPVDNGTVASLTAVLRAILVSGYGAKSGAGWTEPYAASGNVAVFRMNSSVRSGAYLRVDDSGSGTGGAREALVRMFHSMSSLSVGADPAPTAVQLAGGGVVRKSNALDSTARPWYALACRGFIYLFIDSSNAGSPSSALSLFAGDCDSSRPADGWPGLIIAGDTQNSATRGRFASSTVAINGTPASNTGAYLVRESHGASGAVQAAAVSPFGSNQQLGGIGIGYPHQANNGLWYGRVIISEGASKLRGWLPNVIVPWHANPFADRSVQPGFPAVGTNCVAKTFREVEGSGTFLQLLLDITTPF